MKKVMNVVAAIILCTGARAEVLPSVPLPKVDPDKVLTEQAALKPHVLFVNLDKALEDVLFREAVAAVSLVQAVNLAVAEAKGFEGVNLFEKKPRDRRFGEQAKVVVYVVNKPGMVSFLNAPGYWALVNLSGLDRDKPEAERYRRRLRQMMLKGLAHACGVGATFDARCVMYSESFTLEGMDKTSVSYSPFASGPLDSQLKALGGEAILRYAEEQQ